MEKFRLKRSNPPSPLQIRRGLQEQPQYPNRPLSDDIPKDMLAALDDIVPSRSLPATPLTKKRSDPTHFSSPESPVFTDPVTPDSPTMAIPVEVNDVSASGVANDGRLEHINKQDESEKIKGRHFVWDKIRENLDSDEVYSQSYEEEQEWMNHSSGLEQLRAFLAVCN
jgi:hypothetical protein